MKREILPLSLILCDIDYFKQYNDTYGHQIGDDCLCYVAKVLEKAARCPADLAARYGGEEFVLLLPRTDLAGAINVAQSIQTTLQQLSHQASEVSPYMTMSFGIISLIPNETTTPEQLLLDADQALYRAKLKGRNRIQAISPL
jgi:diguanylate cyclase (GGDEF)-like protein